LPLARSWQNDLARRFPPPWTIEELDACFIVKDSNEQALGYVYYEVRATYLSYAPRVSLSIFAR